MINTRELSHKKIKPFKENMYDRILRYLKEAGPQTEPEMLEALGMIRSSLSGRLAELRACGRVVVVGTKFNEETQRDINLYNLVDQNDSLKFKKERKQPDLNQIFLREENENLNKKLKAAYAVLKHLLEVEQNIKSILLDFKKNGGLENV